MYIYLYLYFTVRFLDEQVHFIIGPIGSASIDPPRARARYGRIAVEVDGMRKQFATRFHDDDE